MGASGSPLLVKLNVRGVAASAEEACDETPLLDQGLVEASGSFVLLTFALKGKAR